MLYKRIIGEGTINEKGGKPDPQFALPSTVNWMLALRILVEESKIDFQNAKKFYLSNGMRRMNSFEENTILEQLFLSLHHLSALERMQDSSPSADFSRIAIMTWYYGISNAASAMIAAKNGSFQEDHAGTAKMWDEHIAASGLAMAPFDWRVSSLIEPVYKAEVDVYRAGSVGKLHNAPSSVQDARGAAAGYLSGSAAWHAWKVTQEVAKSSDYKKLGVSSFRSKAARVMRDSRLSARAMGFVHQASRYRGKANYREALFLAYGKTTEKQLEGFIADQAYVLKAFLAMAGAFASRKLGKVIWDEFVADVDANRAFTTSAISVWNESFT